MIYIAVDSIFCIKIEDKLKKKKYKYIKFNIETLKNKVSFINKKFNQEDILIVKSTSKYFTVIELSLATLAQ